MVTTSAAGGHANKKNKQEEEVNIEQLMDEIKRQICFCYSNKDYYVPDPHDKISDKQENKHHTLEQL